MRSPDVSSNEEGLTGSSNSSGNEEESKDKAEDEEKTKQEVKKEEEREGGPITQPEIIPIFLDTHGAADIVKYDKISPQEAILHIARSRDIDLFKVDDMVSYANKLLKKVHPLASRKARLSTKGYLYEYLWDIHEYAKTMSPEGSTSWSMKASVLGHSMMNTYSRRPAQSIPELFVNGIRHHLREQIMVNVPINADVEGASFLGTFATGGSLKLDENYSSEEDKKEEG